MTAVTPALLFRGALAAAGAALWTAAGCWAARGQGGGALEAVAFVGGWSLSVLPVHARIDTGTEPPPDDPGAVSSEAAESSCLRPEAAGSGGGDGVGSGAVSGAG